MNLKFDLKEEMDRLVNEYAVIGRRSKIEDRLRDLGIEAQEVPRIAQVIIKEGQNIWLTKYAGPICLDQLKDQDIAVKADILVQRCCDLDFAIWQLQQRVFTADVIKVVEKSIKLVEEKQQKNDDRVSELDKKSTKTEQESEELLRARAGQERLSSRKVYLSSVLLKLKIEAICF
jgi:hypothetical protein